MYVGNRCMWMFRFVYLFSKFGRNQIWIWQHQNKCQCIHISLGTVEHCTNDINNDISVLDFFSIGNKDVSLVDAQNLTYLCMNNFLCNWKCTITEIKKKRLRTIPSKYSMCIFIINKNKWIYTYIYNIYMCSNQPYASCRSIDMCLFIHVAFV